jgi:hypothetical protein
LSFILSKVWWFYMTQVIGGWQISRCRWQRNWLVGWRRLARGVKEV